MLEQTLSKMRTMRLTSMATSMEERMNRGDHRDVSVEDFVSLLVDDEYTARKNRKLSRMLGRANFGPDNPCFEDIKYSADRNFAKKDLLEFTKEKWIKDSKNMIITGPTGTGKTYLSGAIGRQACYLGYSVWKIRYKRLFEEIKMARGTGQYLKLIGKLDKIQILILDDFLMDSISDQDASDLMEIIESRIGRMSIIVTTQYPVSKWHGQLKNFTIADGICDRLINSSIHFNLKGASMRKK